MFFSIQNNIKNNTCSNALDAVTMGYNGAISRTFKNQPSYPYYMNDDSKQAAKGKIGHRLAEPGL
jgi:hypothetical protein